MKAIAQLTRGWATEAEAPFKRNKTGWVITILNILMALNSTFVFLGLLKVGLDGWLMMNSCAPSIALFVAGFLLESPILMIASSVLMFRYGTLGLFVFSWSGTNLIAQVGHILMTIAVLYTLVDLLRNRRWKSLGLGLLLGAAILIPYLIAQERWFAARPGMLENLFSGDYGTGKP
jgi:uncharacterized membrane protein